MQDPSAGWMSVAEWHCCEAETEIGIVTENAGGPQVCLEYRLHSRPRCRRWADSASLGCRESEVVCPSKARCYGIGSWLDGILLVGGMQSRFAHPNAGKQTTGAKRIQYRARLHTNDGEITSDDTTGLVIQKRGCFR